jgi:hypothetical protein
LRCTLVALACLHVGDVARVRRFGIAEAGRGHQATSILSNYKVTSINGSGAPGGAREPALVGAGFR